MGMSVCAYDCVLALSVCCVHENVFIPPRTWLLKLLNMQTWPHEVVHLA